METHRRFLEDNFATDLQVLQTHIINYDLRHTLSAKLAGVPDEPGNDLKLEKLEKN